ncbi:hypothetical protein ADIS_3971 [Lunatimonas lonarensis]|uniref:Uncharacterized protein n=1 Tax=Lunatimonas lonarensis TaxID=1232681 RepID=R7ZNB6_9BACT|nr:hypothetical protein ADIS_3971 [Lunatimonas lonarensis]
MKGFDKNAKVAHLPYTDTSKNSSLPKQQKPPPILLVRREKSGNYLP